MKATWKNSCHKKAWKESCGHEWRGVICKFRNLFMFFFLMWVFHSEWNYISCGSLVVVVVTLCVTMAGTRISAIHPTEFQWRPITTVVVLVPLLWEITCPLSLYLRIAAPMLLRGSHFFLPLLPRKWSNLIPTSHVSTQLTLQVNEWSLTHWKNHACVNKWPKGHSISHFYRWPPLDFC